MNPSIEGGSVTVLLVNLVCTENYYTNTPLSYLNIHIKHDNCKQLSHQIGVLFLNNFVDTLRKKTVKIQL